MDTIKDEALVELKKIGYEYCNGICNSTKGWTYGWPRPKGNMDGVIFAYRSDRDFGAVGILGNAITWTYYPTSAPLLNHEVGHNLGLGHDYTTKVRYDEVFYNSKGKPGFSALGNDAMVNIDSEQSRYVSNGHFDVAAKHWFGWIDDEQVVFMHPGGASTSCPLCVTSFTGKINAFDRPDVIPGRTGASSGSPYFAVKIPLTSAGTDSLYIFYRSGWTDTRIGVQVQYTHTMLQWWVDVGMNMRTFVYDAAGDSAEMKDSAILPGTTYVAAPPPIFLEKLGLASFDGVIPVITVYSVPDFSDCPNMLCPPNKDLSASISVRFATPAEVASVHPGLTIVPSMTNEITPPMANGSLLVRIADHERGAGGRGSLQLSVCPIDGLDEATVYLYDDLPMAHLLFSAPPSYQAINKFKVLAADCCQAGESWPVFGVRAVVIRQMLNEMLSIAELEAYLSTDPLTNVAPRATCYSLPMGEGYYMANWETAVLTRITDGLTSTISHSSDRADAKYGALESGFGHFDMCVFDEPLPVARLKITPREGLAVRSQRLSVEAYASVTADLSDPTGLRPIGLVFRQNISMPLGASLWSTELTLPPLPAQISCEPNVQTPFSFPTVQGSSYAVVKTRTAAGRVRMRWSLNSTACPLGAYLVPLNNTPGGMFACRPCPARALDFPGTLRVCPSPLCTAVVVSGNYSGQLPSARALSGGNTVFGMDAAPQAGLRRYTARSNASIAWNASAGAWALLDAGGQLLASRRSPAIGPFDGVAAGWAPARASTSPGMGIKAVVVEMDQAGFLNLCELGLYDRNGTNLARTRGRCYNFPVWPTGSGDAYWYTGDRVTGAEPKLNDGCLDESGTCKCAHAGSPTPGTFMACVLDAVLPVESIRVTPPPPPFPALPLSCCVSCASFLVPPFLAASLTHSFPGASLPLSDLLLGKSRELFFAVRPAARLRRQVGVNPENTGRSSRLNLKLYDRLPDGPISAATFADPAGSRLHLDMSAAVGQTHAVCYLSVGAPGSEAAAAAGVAQDEIIGGGYPWTPPPVDGVDRPATTTALGAPPSVAPGGGGNATNCPAPPAQVCCTRLVSRTSSSLSVRFMAEARLVSLALTSRGAPLAWGADWVGLGVTLFSEAGGGSSTDCLLVDAASGAASLPGYRTKAAVCRVRGRRMLLRLPAGRPDDSELQVTLCVSETGSALDNAKVSVQE
jgi:hypothetical protein